jgi:enterochelin esterase-like enzyme
MSRSRIAAWLPRLGPAVASALAAAVVVVVALVSGTIDSTNTTLVLMGFDTDRAQLIAALLFGGTAGAAAALVTGRIGPPTLAGLGGTGALFGYTFVHQTHQALKASGPSGSFDLGGWVLTVLALSMAGVIASWAGVVLALAVRPWLVESRRVVVDAIRRRRLDARRLRFPLGVIAVALSLAISMPVFGDIVNYTTDSRMLHGGPPPVGLIPQAMQPDGTKALPSERPWLSWLPSGSGSVAEVNLPAPWNEGPATTENIGIYTPPGYNPNGRQRYPVLYEAPFDYSLWDSSINFKVAMDALIDSGAIPPMIVVFINAWRAPIADTECANSVDGRQWMDTFISQTVVSYVDTHYPTIATAAARAVFGFSEGGYCAAILPLRHPTVFGTGIPISGYFWAGEGDANSGLPFAGDRAALAEASPMIAATRLTEDQRAKLYFVVVAKPGQPFFGAEAGEFEHLLSMEGYPHLSLSSDLPHGWDQTRQELPAALEAWASHLVSSGALSTGS